MNILFVVAYGLVGGFFVAGVLGDCGNGINERVAHWLLFFALLPIWPVVFVARVLLKVAK